MKIQDFYKHLKNNLDDWEYRSVFADWLFEHNYSELEKAQRWMIENKKHPYRWMSDERKPRFLYIWGGCTYRVDVFPACKITIELLKEMEICDFAKDYNISNWRYFLKLQDAEEALSKVLHENTRFL